MSNQIKVDISYKNSRVYTFSNPSELDTLYTEKEKQIVISNNGYTIGKCIDAIKQYNNLSRFSIVEKSYNNSDNTFSIKLGNGDIVQAKFVLKGDAMSYNPPLLCVNCIDTNKYNGLKPKYCTNIAVLEDVITKYYNNVINKEEESKREEKERAKKAEELEHKIDSILAPISSNIIEFDKQCQVLKDVIFKILDVVYDINVEDTDKKPPLLEKELHSRFCYVATEYIRTNSISLPDIQTIITLYKNDPFICSKLSYKLDMYLVPLNYVCINKYKKLQAFRLAKKYHCFVDEHEGLITNIEYIKSKVSNTDDLNVILDGCEIVENPDANSKCVIIYDSNGFTLTTPNEVVNTYTLQNGNPVPLVSIIAQAKNQNKVNSIYSTRLLYKPNGEKEKFLTLPYPNKPCINGYKVNENPPILSEFISDVAILDDNGNIEKIINGNVFSNQYKISLRYPRIISMLQEYNTLEQKYTQISKQLKELYNQYHK